MDTTNKQSRVAIISGASSGIGMATALSLSTKGIRIILNGRNIDKLSNLKNQIDLLTGAEVTHFVPGDITNKETIDKCITAAIEKWKLPPSIFIASAGRGLSGTLLTSKPEEWTELIDTNVKGLMYQLRCIGKYMIETVSTDYVSNQRDIIVIGSNIGRNVSPFNSVYGATKFATHGLTEALRRELGPKGIRVTLIEPGIVATNFQRTAGYDQSWFEKYSEEVGPVLSGEDVARVIDFLIHLPGNVHLDNISIRPTRQSYP